MRIIKEGHLPEYLHTCRKCGCVFAWDEGDVIVSSNGQYLAVECPCCHARNDTSKDKLVEHGCTFVKV